MPRSVLKRLPSVPGSFPALELVATHHAARRPTPGESRSRLCAQRQNTRPLHRSLPPPVAMRPTQKSKEGTSENGVGTRTQKRRDPSSSYLLSESQRLTCGSARAIARLLIAGQPLCEPSASSLKDLTHL